MTGKLYKSICLLILVAAQPILAQPASELVVTAPFSKTINLTIANALDITKHTLKNVRFAPGNIDETPANTSYSEKTKQITRSYKVSEKDKLSINNKFGRVTINVWGKDEIKVDVIVKSYEISDGKAQELLDGVSITESKQDDFIGFKTNVSKENSPGWWESIRRRIESDQKRGIEVNYIVYMPSKNPLNINNSYGSTLIPDFNGPLGIITSYGTLNAQRLVNADNRIKVSYSAVNIETFSGSLDLSYGSLNLTNADKLNAKISYSTAKINKLTNSADLNIRYTPGFKINEIDKDVKNLVINSSYSDIKLGLDETARYNFDVTVNNGGFSYNDNQAEITNRSADDKTKGFTSEKNYKGTYGPGRSNSKIVIKSSYSAIKFL